MTSRQRPVITFGVETRLAAEAKQRLREGGGGKGTEKIPYAAKGRRVNTQPRCVMPIAPHDDLRRIPTFVARISQTARDTGATFRPGERGEKGLSSSRSFSFTGALTITEVTAYGTDRGFAMSSE